MSEDWQEDASFEAIPYPEHREYPDDQMIARAGAFYDQMKRRHTVRAFSEKPVPKEVIEKCLLTAGLAPNGANRQPWHFAVLGPGEVRRVIRRAAEKEERDFYAGRAGQEWLEALMPLGTNPDKPFLETAPWLVVVFAQRYELRADGGKRKNYYVPESVGIACGFLVAALHHAGLVSLTHTPSPMGFLNEVCDRPENEKPLMIVAIGHLAADATIPREALNKKSLDQIASFL